MDNGEGINKGIMDFGDSVKVVYIDGKRPDGTEHISYKTGEFIKISNNFFCLKVNSQEIMIPSSRIIRIEKSSKEVMGDCLSKQLIQNTLLKTRNKHER